MTVTPTYELLYFQIWGLGEIPRLVFEHAGVPFKNSTIAWDEFQQTGKAQVPFGKLPILKITQDDGKEITLAQSGAIVRYLGKKFGLVGTTPEDQAFIESIYDEYTDFTFGYINKFARTEHWKDLKEVQSYRDISILPFIKNHERFLAANGSNGHYVGDKISIADIAAYQTLNWVFNTPYGTMFNKNDTPNIIKVHETVAADPKIKEYVSSGRRFQPFAWQTKREGQVEL
ncbi:hypothetical protein HK097_008110 [Rhizophlyctis rosea]|uniref:Glutathione S-transferase n=1 Tax=Rhizophlyctis rosea TaxID=64517 RepID=A0AAD5SAM8_9FUNG|nr:hypothetical protein HK097_008110 [Rhizophlyctis rosea]